MLQVREQAETRHVVGAARIDLPLASVSPKDARTSKGSTGKAAVEPIDIPDEGTDRSPTGSDLLTEQLHTAFAAGGFTGRRCVVSLAREDISIQSLRLPKMPDHELRQSAVWEASQRFGFDRHAMEVDFIRTGATLQSGENREEVILIAASHAAIHARLEPVLAAGLRPVAIDTGFAALVRTFSRQARRDDDASLVRAIVEIGTSGATVLIVRGDQIAFCKPIAISGNQFNQAVAEHLQMDPRAAAELRSARIAAIVGGGNSPGSITDPATDRAVFEAVRPLMGELVKEVTLCLRYYGVTFRGHPPDRIILTGGDGLEPRLDELMTRSCKLPVVFDDSNAILAGLIGDIHSTLNRTPGPAASWAVSAGLSLRGIGPARTRRSGEPIAEALKGAA